MCGSFRFRSRRQRYIREQLFIGYATSRATIYYPQASSVGCGNCSNSVEACGKASEMTSFQESSFQPALRRPNHVCEGPCITIATLFTMCAPVRLAISLLPISRPTMTVSASGSMYTRQGCTISYGQSESLKRSFHR
jgi:hypothetical protein